jgi:hypothetical protein
LDEGFGDALVRASDGSDGQFGPGFPPFDWEDDVHALDGADCSHLFNRALGISNTTSRVLMMGWCWVLVELGNSNGQQKPLVVGRKIVFTREDFLCPSAPTLTTSPTP